MVAAYKAANDKGKTAPSLCDPDPPHGWDAVRESTTMLRWVRSLGSSPHLSCEAVFPKLFFSTDEVLDVTTRM
jgi:hypothetical protein